ncbi:DUF2075 domain-containing protein [Pedobacter heparinus]|uniref:ATP/GTP-binding protein, putative n=1 Tax=Pedobacter heparinus (strain ATCC 13125 / DSM 2366 / CIP 104194 / JCM 7457 / NBRC 12017 / NCIMB 9290 / NRRL B-14731 / HIM 762-3) TaxID=485917 RepID=C6Y2T8_PEDHD|nr:DUF2075 domain-containing protein [Pedobacter heparinus]ACU03151.1 ATP/GTP-binding protein, putative [Pedobacter heparinus DSM 2366]
MRLYAGSSTEFIALCNNNKIADLLEEAYLAEFLCTPSKSEITSWKSSLCHLAELLDRAGLKDLGIMLEYKLPLSGKRVDAILCGTDHAQNKQAILIELKQWEECRLTDYDSDYVVTWIGGKNRSVLHPSVQVGNYMYYLWNNSEVFYRSDRPVKLSACSYLHNYSLLDDDVILDKRFENAIRKFPLFTADEAAAFIDFIAERVGSGKGMEVLAEIEESELKPSQKILDKVSTAIRQKLKGELTLFGRCKSKKDYILLDEQLVVYDLVMSLALKDIKGKHAVVVRGGAGTGKSVIGLQLLADLTASRLNAQYATGSNAFTETLREILGQGSSSILKYFMSYTTAAPQSVDVLLMDEAHRIREKTAGFSKRTDLLQIQELLNAAKVCVFFVDDYQVVRREEIGTSGFIIEQAEAAGFKVYEFDLKANFRNGGSERYSHWIDHMLQIRETAHTEWVDETNFKFEIVDAPETLERIIQEKAMEGSTARITAGFCWDWTKRLDKDGQLVKDIRIGSYHRPWNAYNNLEGLQKEIPKAKFWAYQRGGIDQIGCIFTAQGFEFDYTGVIFGKDIRYNPTTGQLEGFEEFSYDYQVRGTHFLRLIKNTYRVLLGRGMKGCYVYFMDKETESYFRSRVRENKGL